MKAEMLILGVLHRGNFHPYEIKRRLTGAMVECFTDVDVGTLYYAIRQLATAGHIQAISHKRVPQGGTRTVYRITAAGRARFHALLMECFAASGSVASTLYGAMLFVHWCDPKRLGSLLLEKISRQKQAIEELRSIAERMRPVLGTGGAYLIEHLAQVRALDLRWLKRLHAEVAAGRVRDVPEPAKLASARR